jgi:trans-2,3-dihydro-3-hydroxyanthranilate isomerase
MTRSFEFALVDAFADKPLTGNPCAVVVVGDTPLTDIEMLAIAKETNQSETAFLMNSKTADLKAKYFTPEREIPLAGHPTIASIHAAFDFGLLKRQESTQSVLLELNDGPITVEIETQNDNSRLIRMFQRKPIFGEIHDPNIVLPIFSLSLADLLDGFQIQTVSTGTRQLMVPLASIESLKKLSMNVDKYKEYRNKKDFFSPHFFCTTAINSDAQTFARHLGVPPDTLEDAFTGSATGGMAAYLWRNRLIKNPQFIAEQGHWMGRPGRAWVSVYGSADDIQSVSVAGTAVTVMRGVLSI